MRTGLILATILQALFIVGCKKTSDAPTTETATADAPTTVAPTTQTVKAGRRSGDRVEILDGLAKNDVVLLKKPQDGD